MGPSYYTQRFGLAQSKKWVKKMLTTIITVIEAVISAIAIRGIDFGLAISGTLVGLSILFQVCDFKENEKLKTLEMRFSPHMKIFVIIFCVFFALKMISLI